jgi:hypothetical protein
MKKMIKRAVWLVVIWGFSAASAQISYFSQQVLTAHGVPASTVQVRVCASTDLTTPCSATVPIYSDNAGAHSVSNPTYPDSLGNLSFYAIQGYYRLQYYYQGSLLNSATVLLPVASGGGGGGGGGSGTPGGSPNDVQINLAGAFGTDTGQFTYLPSTHTLSAPNISTKTFGRTLFNAVAYGADPTSATDSCSSLTATIAAAGALNGDVYLPAGSYKSSCELDITSAIHFYGAGNGPYL